MSILDSISEHVHNQITAQDVNKNIATGIKGKDRDEIPSENKEQGYDSIDQAMHNDQTRNDTLQDRGSQAVEGRESIQHEIGEISNLIIRDGSKFSNTQTGNLVYKDDIDWARSAYPMHPPSPSDKENRQKPFANYHRQWRRLFYLSSPHDQTVVQCLA